MKTIIKCSILSLVILFMVFSSTLAQNKVVVVNEKHPRSKVVVVKNNRNHIQKMKVYHPHWAPRASFRHRWVYFPRYNFYWDNFRDVYVIRTGTVWVLSKNAPKEVEQVDLSKEKSVELNEENDNREAIQDKNAEHQVEYKVK